MNKFKKLMLGGLSLLGIPALAEGAYTVPAGVTQALSDAEAAATALANSAIPSVAKVAMAFVGLVVVWLVIRAIRRGAK